MKSKEVTFNYLITQVMSEIFRYFNKIMGNSMDRRIKTHDVWDI